MRMSDWSSDVCSSELAQSAIVFVLLKYDLERLSGLDRRLEHVARIFVAIDRDDLRADGKTRLEGRAVPADLADLAAILDAQADAEAMVGAVAGPLGPLGDGARRIAIDHSLAALGRELCKAEVGLSVSSQGVSE